MSRMTWLLISLLAIVGCHDVSKPAEVEALKPASAPVPLPDGHTYMLSKDTSVLSARQCDDYAERVVLYTANVNSTVKMNISARQYTESYEFRIFDAKMSDELTHPKQWTIFDPEDVPRTLLNKDLIPEISRLSAAIIRFDKNFHPDVNECEDHNGVWWRRIQ